MTRYRGLEHIDPDTGRRCGVDYAMARMEDELTRLREAYSPLNEAEASHLHEIADWLKDFANRTVVQGR